MILFKINFILGFWDLVVVAMVIILILVSDSIKDGAY